MVTVEVLFLNAFIKVLFTRLASPEFVNFASRYTGLRKKLDTWKDTLKRIHAVLDDADEKQGEDGAVKLWLDNLRDLAYDVEDILDDFATETLRGETQATSKLCKLCCTPLTSNINLGTKIKKITDRFNRIVKEKDDLRLRENVDRRIRGTESSSLVDEDRVYGRQKDKDAIIKFLLRTEYNDAEVSVIPIYGMGGVGKTTLAQLVFNDEQVQDFFQVKVWVYVSDDFNVLRLTDKICRSIILQTCEAKDIEFLKLKQDGNNLDLLQGEIRKQLFGMKFLVILDDVWTHEYKLWNDLRAPFLKGTPGSRIIITTRDWVVSSKMGTVPAYPLQVLPDDACFSVFTLHALGARGFSAAPNLEGIGQKISEKCKGLPLAALILAGLLRSEAPDHRKWKEVSNRRILDTPEERDRILSVIMWSYYDLPLHLKMCFAYCSIFPHGYEFEEKQLVLLWMAEGLIHPQAEKRKEDLGSEYFEELVQKSFFKKSNKDESRFMMHDFINDLAQWVARGTCFRVGDGFEDSDKEENLKKARYLSYLCGHSNCHKDLEALSKLTRLRTFLLMPPDHGGIPSLVMFLFNCY